MTWNGKNNVINWLSRGLRTWLPWMICAPAFNHKIGFPSFVLHEILQEEEITTNEMGNWKATPRGNVIAKWPDLYTILLMMIMVQNPFNQKLSIYTNRAKKRSGVQVRNTWLFYSGKNGNLLKTRYSTMCFLWRSPTVRQFKMADRRIASQQN